MSNVQTAVALREAAAPARVTPQQAVKQQLDIYRPVIGKLLTGTGISEETFVAQIANACRANPALWECEPATLLGSALRAAQLGLAPNDVRNLCWIIPYKRQAQFQIGYGGVLELARRAVPGLKFDGRAVYPNDEFDVDFGKPEPLKHRPAVVCGKERGGEAYAWYVRALYPDGGVQIHVLDREGVEQHRKFSKQPNGEMWTKSYDAAALKSVVLDMKRWLPSSAQLVAAFAADEQVIRVDDVTVIDHEDEPLELEQSGTESTEGTPRPRVAEEPVPTAAPAHVPSAVTPDDEVLRPCARCGLTLVGAEVEAFGRGYAHKGGCQGSASPRLGGEGEPAEAGVLPSEGAPPTPVDHLGDLDICKLAEQVFAPAKETAPRGRKSKIVDECRHALAWGVTKGRTGSLKVMTAEEKHRLFMELSWLADGFNQWRIKVDESGDEALVVTHKDEEPVVIPLAAPEPVPAA